MLPRIPIELQVKIVSYLDNKDLLQFSYVSSLSRQIANDVFLDKILNFSVFNNRKQIEIYCSYHKTSPGNLYLNIDSKLTQKRVSHLLFMRKAMRDFTFRGEYDFYISDEIKRATDDNIACYKIFSSETDFSKSSFALHCEEMFAGPVAYAMKHINHFFENKVNLDEYQWEMTRVFINTIKKNNLPLLKTIINEFNIDINTYFSIAGCLDFTSSEYTIIGLELTLLGFAVFYGKIDIVKYLILIEGADVNAKPPSGSTAVDILLSLDLNNEEFQNKLLSSEGVLKQYQDILLFLLKQNPNLTIINSMEILKNNNVPFYSTEERLDMLSCEKYGSVGKLFFELLGYKTLLRSPSSDGGKCVVPILKQYLLDKKSSMDIENEEDSQEKQNEIIDLKLKLLE